jgi:hypothetical protein
MKVSLQRVNTSASIRIYYVQLPNTSSNKLQTCVPSNESDQRNQKLGYHKYYLNDKKVVYLKFIEYMMFVLIPRAYGSIGQYFIRRYF